MRMRICCVAGAWFLIMAGCRTSSEPTVTTIEKRAPATAPPSAASHGGVSVISIRSIREHRGGGRLAIELGGVSSRPSASESREGGIRELELRFSEPVKLARGGELQAMLGDHPFPLHANLPAPTLLAIRFEKPLENGCLHIRLSDAIEGLDKNTTLTVRALAGDANGDGRVELSDALLIKSRAGRPVAQDTAAFDINLSGEKIDPKDIQLAKAAVGHKAECE